MFWEKKSVIIGGPLVVLFLLTLGLYDNLFHTTAYYDVFMHSLTGGLFVITFAGIVWHLRLKKRPDRQVGIVVKLGLIAGLFLAAIIWEIAEVVFNMTPNWTTSIPDTISDVVYALMGGTISLFLIRSTK